MADKFNYSDYFASTAPAGSRATTIPGTGRALTGMDLSSLTDSYRKQLGMQGLADYKTPWGADVDKGTFATSTRQPTDTVVMGKQPKVATFMDQVGPTKATGFEGNVGPVSGAAFDATKYAASVNVPDTFAETGGQFSGTPGLAYSTAGITPSAAGFDPDTMAFDPISMVDTPAVAGMDTTYSNLGLTPEGMAPATVTSPNFTNTLATPEMGPTVGMDPGSDTKWFGADSIAGDVSQGLGLAGEGVSLYGGLQDLGMFGGTSTQDFRGQQMKGMKENLKNVREQMADRRTFRGGLASAYA